MQSEGTWKDNRREGVFTFWHENGQIAAQGEYRRGKREGRFLYLHPDGTIDTLQSGRYVSDAKVAG